jgi:hypothetical protein
MNFVIITLIITILLLLFIVISYLIGSDKPLVNNVHLLKGVPEIPLSSLKIKDYGTYSIELWLYVNKFPIQSYNSLSDTTYRDSNNNFYKNMLTINNINSSSIIFSTYNRPSNPLYLLNLYLFSEGILVFQNGRYANGVLLPSLKTDNFPIQKWTYIIISVSKNSLVELYMNGKLVQSANYNSTYGGLDSLNALQRPFVTDNDKLIFGNKIDAYISNMFINSKAMDTNTAWKKYMNGPSVKTNYNIGVSLTQDAVNTHSINML